MFCFLWFCKYISYTKYDSICYKIKCTDFFLNYKNTILRVNIKSLGMLNATICLLFLLFIDLSIMIVIGTLNHICLGKINVSMVIGTSK